MFNILIVDDDQNIRRHVRSICNRAGSGIGIFEAVDSQEALTLLEDNIIALAIVDLHLPDMMGTDLLKIVKQQYGGIKVIMLSGDNSFDYVRQSFLYKADDYIEKPVNETVLLQKVCELREKYFLGLTTIELPKKNLSEYMAFALNEEFSRLTADDEDKFLSIKDRYHLSFCDGNGTILAIQLEGLSDDQNSEYFYSFLAERLKRDFTDCEVTFMFMGGMLYAVLSYEKLDTDTLRSRFHEIKKLFNENGIVITVYVSEPFNPETGFFESYRGLLDLLRNRSVYGKNEMVFYTGPETGSSQVAVVQRAKRYIQGILYESFSLSDVSEYLGVHPNYLSKVFKRSEGISFSDYVCDCKMKEAKHMLLDTNMKIYEISEKLHYYDTGYFIRIFKKYYGISPNQFRQRR